MYKYMQKKRKSLARFKKLHNYRLLLKFYIRLVDVSNCFL